MANVLDEKPLAKVENHHNFPWKEQLDNSRVVITHHNGAMPTGTGILGIIPGSMTPPGFIIRGRNGTGSLASASHGAGRQMSRTRAKAELDGSQVRKYLADHGIERIGSRLDEAPKAYKAIHAVMASQRELANVLSSFTAKIMRMYGA